MVIYGNACRYVVVMSTLLGRKKTLRRYEYQYSSFLRITTDLKIAERTRANADQALVARHARCYTSVGKYWHHRIP